jgi:DNA-binding IclR family transcriptional regulator
MAMARVLHTLRLLANEPEGLTLTQLISRLDAPKTSIHAILKGLATEGYLQRQDLSYRLGPKSYLLGAAIVAARSLAVAATPFLREARALSGESVLLAVIDPPAGQLTYTQIIESHKPVRYAVPIGTTRPLYASSAGRVLIAFQDAGWRREYLRTTELRAMTDKTVTNRRQLTRIISQVQACGYAATIGEVTPDVAGFSAPIFEPGGRVNAAVIVAAPIERGRASAERLTKIAVETAARLSQALGGHIRTSRPI